MIEIVLLIYPLISSSSPMMQVMLPFRIGKNFCKQFCIHTFRNRYRVLCCIRMHLRIQIFFLIKCFFKQLCIFLPVIIQDVGIYIRNHADLGMSGISLDSFNISTIQFQLIGNTAVSETVENNRWRS